MNTVVEMMAWLNDEKTRIEAEDRRSARSAMFSIGYREALCCAIAKLEAIAAMNEDEVC